MKRILANYVRCVKYIITFVAGMGYARAVRLLPFRVHRRRTSGYAGEAFSLLLELCTNKAVAHTSWTYARNVRNNPLLPAPCVPIREA